MSQKKISVGEEAIIWAEKYWLIDKIIKGEIGKGDGEAEAMPYDYFRSAFIKAINDIIAERINLYNS